MQDIASNDHYRIAVDNAKNRVYLTINGTWSAVSEVPNYLSDLKRAAGSLKNGWTILADTRNMKPPSPEVVELHVKAQAAIIAAGLAKTAEIQPASAITKLSVERFSKESGMEKGIFASPQEGEAWLDSIN